MVRNKYFYIAMLSCVHSAGSMDGYLHVTRTMTDESYTENESPTIKPVGTQIYTCVYSCGRK